MSENFFSFDIDPRRDVYVRLIGEMHAALDHAMDEEQMTKAEVARKLDVHKSVVTRRLSGTTNMTFESLADLAWALNRRVKLALVPLTGAAAGSNKPPAPVSAAVKAADDLRTTGGAALPTTKDLYRSRPEQPLVHAGAWK